IVPKKMIKTMIKGSGSDIINLAAKKVNVKQVNKYFSSFTQAKGIDVERNVDFMGALSSINRIFIANKKAEAEMFKDVGIKIPRRIKKKKDALFAIHELSEIRFGRQKLKTKFSKNYLEDLRNEFKDKNFASIASDTEINDKLMPSAGILEPYKESTSHISRAVIGDEAILAKMLGNSFFKRAKKMRKTEADYLIKDAKEELKVDEEDLLYYKKIFRNAKKELNYLKENPNPYKDIDFRLKELKIARKDLSYKKQSVGEGRRILKELQAYDARTQKVYKSVKEKWKSKLKHKFDIMQQPDPSYMSRNANQFSNIVPQDIAGLSEQGYSAATRNWGTGFGSGWKGIDATMSASVDFGGFVEPHLSPDYSETLTYYNNKGYDRWPKIEIKIQSQSPMRPIVDHNVRSLIMIQANRKVKSELTKKAMATQQNMASYNAFFNAKYGAKGHVTRGR
ncbi:MAG: hypothetical protein ABIJ08_01315, partial [Nanoarchaeota archaeon]